MLLRIKCGKGMIRNIDKYLIDDAFVLPDPNECAFLCPSASNIGRDGIGPSAPPP